MFIGNNVTEIYWLITEKLVLNIYETKNWISHTVKFSRSNFKYRIFLKKSKSYKRPLKKKQHRLIMLYRSSILYFKVHL